MAALRICARLKFSFRVRVWHKTQPLPGVGNLMEVELIKSCLGDFGPPMPPAKLIIDGLADRARAARIRKGLADHHDVHGNPCIQTVRLQDSASSDHLQLADLIAGWSVSPPSANQAWEDITLSLSPKGTCRAWP
jgi:hypothetical protein